MKIAIHGLGKMGMQIARKLVEDHHHVLAHNRSPEPIAESATFGAQPAPTKQDVINAFGSDQVILWLMLPAEVTTSEISAWLSLLPKGSLLIDGGNSHFQRTKEHATTIAGHGIPLLYIGTSCGVLGLNHGFCMMVGGDCAGYATIKPILISLAAPEGAFQYFGHSGSGHYVKMVHNAIEYGMMESLAEGFQMLREGDYPSIDLAAAGEVWQHGSVIESLLNRLAADALRENPTLTNIDGYVAENGEARWALEAANEKGIPLPSIQAAFNVRLASQKGKFSFATKLLAAMRNKFGAHALNKD